MKNIGKTETPFQINFRDSIQNTENSISDEIYNTCFNDQKLCFGLPDGCVQKKTCGILGLSFPNSSIVKFELLAPIQSNPQNYYIAYSLSKISVNIFEIMKIFN
jgi:hypothetical protein